MLEIAPKIINNIAQPTVKAGRTLSRSMFLPIGIIGGAIPDVFEKASKALGELTKREKKIYEKIEEDIPENLEITNLKQFIQAVKKDEKTVLKLLGMNYYKDLKLSQNGILEIVNMKKKDKEFFIDKMLCFEAFDRGRLYTDEAVLIGATKALKTKKERKVLKNLILPSYQSELKSGIFKKESLDTILKSLQIPELKDTILDMVSTYFCKTDMDSLADLLKFCNDKQMAKRMVELHKQGYAFGTIKHIFEECSDDADELKFLDDAINLREERVVQDGSKEKKVNYKVLLPPSIYHLMRAFRSSPDKEFASKILNLKSLNLSGSWNYTTVWHNGTEILDFISATKDPVKLGFMKKVFNEDADKFRNLVCLNLPKANEDAIRKYEYLHDSGIEMEQNVVAHIGYSLPADDFIEKHKMIKSLFKKRKDVHEYTKTKQIVVADNLLTAKQMREVIDFARAQGANDKEIWKNLMDLTDDLRIGFWKEVISGKSIDDKSLAAAITMNMTQASKDIILKLCNEPNLKAVDVYDTVNLCRDALTRVAEVIYSHKDFPREKLVPFISKINYIKKLDLKNIDVDNSKYLYTALKNLTSLEKEILFELGINVNDVLATVSNIIGGKEATLKITTEAEKNLFSKVLANRKDVEKAFKKFDFAQFEKNGLPLKYTRDEFCANLDNLLKDLQPQEQEIVLKHFGLVQGVGGYEGLLNNEDFGNNPFSGEITEVAGKVKKEIDKFIYDNEIMVDDLAVKKQLDALIKGFPQFLFNVGKKQHGTHIYSVDIHSLVALQKALNNPLYEELDDASKTVLKISVILHDIGKRGGVVDSGHAHKSSEYVRSVINNIKVSDDIKQRVVEIIDNHHWFESYCELYNTKNTYEAAKDVLKKFQNPSDLKILQIFAKADFESVSKSFHFSRTGCTSEKGYNTYISKRFGWLEECADNFLYSKPILLNPSKFAPSLFPTEKVKIDDMGEVELKVLNLSKISPKTDLKKLGFNCSSLKDLRFLIHMISPCLVDLDNVKMFTENSLNNRVWSMSYIKSQGFRTYQEYEYGFVLDIDNSSIIMAHSRNIGSGTQKNEDFLSDTFELSNRHQTPMARSYFSNQFVAALKNKGIELNAEEYIKLSRYLLSLRNFEKLQDFNTGKKVIKKDFIKEALIDAQESLFEKDVRFSRKYCQNEIVGMNPQIKALVARTDSIKECSVKFLKFAKENNLPIILLPE